MSWRDRLAHSAERDRVAARVRELLATADRVPAAESGGWLPPPFGASQSATRGDAAEPPIDQALTVAPAPAHDDLPAESAITGRSAWLRWGRAVPSRRTMVAVAGVAVMVAVAAAVMVISSPPGPRTVATHAQFRTPSPTAPTVPTVARAPSSPSASPAGGVVVDVAGLVNNPGLYRLVAGSRVDDALRAAGGPAPGADLSLLNRARLLVDGEQVSVGVPGAPAAPTGRVSSGAAGPAAGSSGKVDLNRADLAALDTLPGVGPVLAQQILDWRQQHGRFASVEQLREVTGIGTAKFASLRDLVTV